MLNRGIFKIKKKKNNIFVIKIVNKVTKRVNVAKFKLEFLYTKA